MRSPDLTREIIGAAIKVHRALGPGLLESAYEACLAYELNNLGLQTERQKAVPLIYENVRLDCGFRADLVVENKVVVETKCKDSLHLLTMHSCFSSPPDEHSCGLLINFHVVLLRDGIKRLVNNYREPIGLVI
jgi:GxxExxY protein